MTPPAPEAGEHVFDEIKRYVGFGPEDEACLRSLGPRVRPHIARISDDFFVHALDHAGARRTITGGDAQVARLKAALVRWMEGLFVGPWDLAYYELRALIGRRHVETSLPQQYMLTAVNVIRRHLTDVALDTAASPDDARREVHALNRLLDMELAVMLHTYREDGLARLQRSERLATFGQLVASIAHELRNPLGVIESSLFLLRRYLPDPPEAAARHLDKIDAQVKASNRTITNLLEVARDRPPDRQRVELPRLAASAIEALTVPATVTVTCRLDASLPPLFVDPDQLRQVLVNLLNNAIDATEGEVLLAARVEGATLVLLVNDDGPGVDASVRPRLFEPLVSTKARGIGLGLALCRRLLERNGATIDLARGPLRGAAFEVRFPLTGES